MADPFPFEDLPDGHGDDLDVQPQGPVVHIPNIQPELLFPGDGVAAVDLRPAGNFRFYFVSPHLRRFDPAP
ncbi:MAG TPA: hypothetical protein PLA32_14160, partial [Smithella sp.]|nr:hypothetical protein [Smithella sp.]